MNNQTKDYKVKAISALDSIIEDFDQNQAILENRDDYYEQVRLYYRISNRAHKIVENISGKNSIYYQHLPNGLYDQTNIHEDLSGIIGIIESLRLDIEFGVFENYSRLIHRKVFNSYLDMAKHFLSEGYKDPAAMIAGCALEMHLRELCTVAEIEIKRKDKDEFQKAENLNTELYKKQIITGYQFKQITAFLDIRNKAAHGLFDQYIENDVELLISWFEEFLKTGIIGNPSI